MITKTGWSLLGKNSVLGKDGLNIDTNKILHGVALIGAGSIIHKAYTAIKNDVTRKNLINDLHLNDAVLSQVPEEHLLEWYATIYHFAPNFSLDKQAVREVLQNFARFGKVDVNTLKMLADTEKATSQAAKAEGRSESSWGSLLTDVAKSVAFSS